MIQVKKTRKKLRKWTVSLLAIVMLVGQSVASAGGMVSTKYGRSFAQDGDVSIATFSNPSNTITDSQTGIMYIADTGNNKIRKYDPDTQTVSTLAGDGHAGYIDGPGAIAAFDQPTGIALDEANGILYVSELGNSTVRVINVTNGDVGTIAGQGVGIDDLGNPVSLNQPYNLLFNPTNNLLYIMDTYNHQIKTYSSNDGIIRIFAGSGAFGTTDSDLLSSSFMYPSDIAYDANTDMYYVSDLGSHTIRKIDRGSNAVQTFAGNGSAGFSNGIAGNLLSASFNGPRSIAVDAEGNVYVADNGNHIIREIVIATNEILTVAGTDQTSGVAYGEPQSSLLSFPSGIRYNPATQFMNITSQGSGVISTFNPRLYTASGAGILPELYFVVGQHVQTGLLDGPLNYSLFNSPQQLTKDESGNVYVADTQNNAIRKISATGMVTTIAGNGSIGNTDGIGSLATFDNPQGITYDPIGNRLFVADTGNHVIRMIDLANFAVTTVAGTGSIGMTNGIGSVATFGTPTTLASDGNNYIYIADSSNFVIRRMSLIAGDNYLVETFAGTNVNGYEDGPLAQAQFSSISSIAIDTIHGVLYIADSANSYIRMIDLSDTNVKTIAGTGFFGHDDGEGISATFRSIYAMTIGTDNKLYFTDSSPGMVRSMDLNADVNGNFSYEVRTLTFGDPSGYVDGIHKYAKFGDKINGMLQLDDGNLLIADTRNNTIRHFDFPPVIAGVEDGGIYNEPAVLTPTFNEGTAVIIRNNGNPDPFTSGSQVYQPGNYILTVTDTAGNETVVSFNIIGNSSKPSITSSDLVNTPTPQIYGYADPGDTVYVDVVDNSNGLQVESGSTVADQNGYWSYQTGGNIALADGIYDIDVYAMDVYGSISPRLNVSLTVDTVPPETPVVDSVTGENTTGPTISGTASVQDLTLHFTVNGGSSSISLAGTDTWDIQLMSMPEGKYTITMWFEDAAGNIGQSATQDFVVDVTPPTVNVNTSDLLQNIDPLTFTGTTEPYAIVHVSIDGISYSFVQADANGNWTEVLPNNVVSEGLHTISVSAVDTVGWPSGVINYTFTFDSIPPATPVITSATLQATRTPVITGTAEANSSVQVHVLGHTYTVQADASGNWSIQVPNGVLTSDGPYLVTVTATDAASNVSGIASFTLTVDTTSPNVPMLTSSLTQNQVLPTFTGFADPGDVLTLQVNGKSYTTTVAGSGAWSLQLPAGDELTDGSYPIQINTQDGAGNTSAAYSGSLVIDTQAPTQPVLTFGVLFTTNRPTFSGTADPGSTVIVIVDGKSYSVPVLVDGTWSLVIPANQVLVDGSYLVKVTAIDAAGNSSPAVTPTITVDTTAPLSAVVTSPNGQTTATPTIKGTAEPNSTVSIQVNGVTYIVNVDARGDWTFTLPNSAALQDGIYQVAISVADAAGLQSSIQTLQLEIDTQGPGQPVLTSPAVQVTSTPTLSGTAEANATIVIAIAGNTYSVVADANGNWTFTVPTGSELRDGLYTINVTPYDALRNQGTSLAVSLSIDATAPNAPTVTSKGSQVTLTPTLAGKAEVGSTVFVEVDGQTYSAVAAANGEWQVAISRALVAGTYTAQVYARDAAGNRSAIVTQVLAVRAANTVASMGGLTISNGKLTPAFSSTVFSYKASVKNATKSILIQPGTLSAGAVVRVNGVVVPAGDSISVALTSGVSNKIGIEVTAEDGVTKVMYTLHVYRKAIKAYIQGYGNKDFRPDALIKREEFAYMLDQLFARGKGSKGTGNYADIGLMYWAKKEIVSVAKKGVMLGYNNGKFGFGQKLTRQQLATIIDRIVGLKKSSKLTFKDTIGMQDSKIMAAAVEAGYMKGYKDGTFRPTEGVTRAEAIILLNKLSNREALTDRYDAQWNDVNTSHYAFAAIQNASISR